VFGKAHNLRKDGQKREEEGKRMLEREREVGREEEKISIRLRRVTLKWSEALYLLATVTVMMGIQVFSLEYFV
jgi:hypothetical protein